MVPSPHAAPLRPVVVSALTLAVAVSVFGFTFGVGAVATGASVTQTCALSLLTFTGASQLSAVSVIAAGGSSLAALAGGLVLAARNAIYGLSMSRLVRGRLGMRLVAAHLVIDESTAMATAQPDGRRARVAFWVTGGSIFVCWNLFTLAGALAGSAIEPGDYGLDAAFPAAFLAMVVPHLTTPRGRQAAVVGAVTCLALVPVLPIGVPVLCASVGILVGLPDTASTARRMVAP